MAENLTKTALKDELSRRIAFFEGALGFTPDMSVGAQRIAQGKPHVGVAFGRYRALLEMRTQIEQGLFIGGPAA